MKAVIVEAFFFVVCLWGITAAEQQSTTKDQEPKKLTIDGLPFTIEQEGWKPSTFNMFGMELDDTQGFVSTDFLPLDNRGYNELMEDCKEQLEEDSIPLYQYSPLGTVNYYPDTDAFDTFKGYDMIPENKDNYIKGDDMDTHLNFVDGKKYMNKTIMMKRCRLPTHDGGAWHLQRVGPFTTTGGYSWVTISWPDWGMLNEVLPKYPQGIDLVRQLFVPIAADGTRLNLPPIHTHHIHILPSPSVRPRRNSRPMCISSSGLGISFLDELFTETTCYNTTFFFEQHGDYNCQPKDDGMDCLMQGDKNPRRIVQMVDLEGELNDVRPYNSEPMEWYYQTAVHWKPADVSKPPVGQLNMLGPGHIFPPSQLTKSYTNVVDPSEETHNLYSSTMPHSGELVRMKAHSHAAIFQASMFFTGKYEDYGLDDPKFIPQIRSYYATPTSQVGFASNAELAHFIFDNLKKSQATWDEKCGEAGKAINDFICARPRPEFICGAVVDTAITNFNGVDYHFDRRPPTYCKPWVFKEGDPYVVVGFNKKIESPPYAHKPGYIPEHMYDHIIFFISFITPDRGHSLMITLTPTFWGTFYDFSARTSPPRLVAMIISVLLWEGPPNSAMTVTIIQYIVFFVFLAIGAGLAYLLLKLSNKIIDTHFSEKAVYTHKYQPVSALEDDELEMAKL